MGSPVMGRAIAQTEEQRNGRSPVKMVAVTHSPDHPLTLQRASEPRAVAISAPQGMHLPPAIRGVLRADVGHPLDPYTRAAMERRFDHDFGSVRVHADWRAARSAEAVGAQAYTVGTDVVFGAGKYRPGSGPERQLLEHELAHVVQQAQSPIQGASRSAAQLEAEAHRASGTVGTGSAEGVPSLSSAPAGILQKQEDPAPAPAFARYPAYGYVVGDYSTPYAAPDPIAEETLSAQEVVETEDLTADQLLEGSLGTLGLNEDRLAARLAIAVQRGKYEVVLAVLDKLRERDVREWLPKARRALLGSGDEAGVATELARRLDDFALHRLFATKATRGPELLDRLYFGLVKSGSPEATQQSERIDLVRRQQTPIESLVEAWNDKGLLILPYRSGLSYDVGRFSNGDVKVRMSQRIFSEFQRDAKRLEAQGKDRLWADGLRLRPDQVIALRDYDKHGRTTLVRADSLLTLTYAALEKFRGTVRYAGEAVLALVTLGFSAPATGVLEGTLLGRAVGVLNTLTVTSSLLAPIVEGNREWIAANLGDEGQAVLDAYDLVNSVVSAYGLAQLAILGGTLIDGLVGKLDRLLSRGLRDLTAEESGTLKAMQSRARSLQRDAARLRQLRPAPPETQLPALPNPAASEDAARLARLPSASSAPLLPLKAPRPEPPLLKVPKPEPVVPRVSPPTAPAPPPRSLTRTQRARFLEGPAANENVEVEAPKRQRMVVGLPPPTSEPLTVGEPSTVPLRLVQSPPLTTPLPPSAALKPPTPRPERITPQGSGVKLTGSGRGVAPSPPEASRGATLQSGIKPRAPSPSAPDEEISEIETVRLTQIGERSRMARGVKSGGLVEEEFQNLAGERGRFLRRGERMPGGMEIPRNVETWARSISREGFERRLYDALRGREEHTLLTLKALEYMNAEQITYVLKTGRLPDGFQFHHFLAVKVYPMFAHLWEVGMPVPKDIHIGAGHGGDITWPVEAATFRDPGYETRPPFDLDPEAVKGFRVSSRRVASGIGSTGDVSRDTLIERRVRLRNLQGKLRELQTQVSSRPSTRLIEQVRTLAEEITRVEWERQQIEALLAKVHP